MSNYSKIYHLYQIWLTEKTTFAEKTIASYLRIAKNFLFYLESLNLLRLNDVDDSLIMQFSHFTFDKRPYAPAFINVRLAALNCFFTWAYEERYCRENPLLSYKKSKIVPKSIKKLVIESTSSTIILNSTEQALLFNYEVDPNFIEIRNKCIAVLILASGLFIDEVITLPLDALSLRQGCINVFDEKNHERKVPINLDICRSACQVWLKARKSILASIEFPSLFFTRQIKPLTRRMLYKIVSEYMLKANIQKSHNGPEVLRQTAICNLLKKYTLEEVKNYTGIKTLSQLEKYLPLIKP